jgi:hypothetical protein
MKYAKIHFNPDKCRLIVHNPTKSLIPELSLPDEHDYLIKLKTCEINDVVKYLGLPLGIRKLVKMRFNNNRIQKVRMILDRIKNSGLKIPQIINVIKGFVIPRLDYSMMNSVMSKTELLKLDDYVRQIINHLFGGPKLSKDLFYTSWKYGGLRLKNLRERYTECKFNNVAHFFLRYQETRNFIKWQIEKEGEKKKVEKDRTNCFI